MIEIILFVLFIPILVNYGIFVYKYMKNKKKLKRIENEIPTVLIVEDDPDSATILTNILYDVCNVTIVNTGEKAVDVCKNNIYPVILMDINLGAGIDGVEAANLIKQFNNYNNTYIIALTSYKPKDVYKEFSNSFAYFIQKPYNRDYVTELVRGLLIKNKN